MKTAVGRGLRSFLNSYNEEMHSFLKKKKKSHDSFGSKNLEIVLFSMPDQKSYTTVKTINVI